jgi:hypothetical protein
MRTKKYNINLKNTISFYPKTQFQPIFDPKHLGNTLKTLLNQSLNSKNEKKKIWNPKSTQNKKSF